MIFLTLLQPPVWMTLYNGWFSQQGLQIILGNFSNGQIRGFSESELSFRLVAEQSTRTAKQTYNVYTFALQFNI